LKSIVNRRGQTDQVELICNVAKLVDTVSKGGVT
jgi:hypothetical protein